MFLALCGTAAAVERNLTFEEKAKVRETLDLVEEMFRKAGRLNDTMVSRLNNSSDPGGAANQVPYESSTATFQDAINKMRDKLDNDRIQVDTDRAAGGKTRNASGTDADVIIIAGGTLTKMCSTGDDAGRFLAKASLGATLANEMVHVWQVFAGNDLRQCDAERDSDTSTLFFINNLAFAIDGTSGPGDIDAEDCPKLAACLAKYGVDAGAEWGTLTTGLNGYANYYANRRSEKFDGKLNAALSWGKGYYGDSNYTGPIRFAEVTTPGSVTLTATNGNTRQYVLPAGKKVLSRTVSRNALNQVVLTIVAQDTTTNVICTYVYTDTDNDTLPELTPAVSQASAPAQNETDNEDLFILPFQPGDTNAEQTAWTFLDVSDGSVYIMPVDPLTLLPIDPFFDLIFVDPLLSDLGGFFYLDEVLPGGANSTFWMFTSTPPVMNHGDQPAAVFQIDLLTGNWIPIFKGTIAEALAPSNDAGILQLDVGLNQIRLAGIPGGDATIFDIGQGPGFPILPPSPLGNDGLTPALPLPPLPPGLFRAETVFLTSQSGVTMFQPPLGENISCILNDENGDGAPERVHLTFGPPRLHVFEGIPGDPLGSSIHRYGLVLETDQARGFESWNNLDGRVLGGMQGEIQIPLTVPIPGFNIPFYFQSLHDLDGDTNADDAVYALSNNLGGGNFNLVSAADVATVPLPLSVQNLNFIPGILVVDDLNNDGFPDALLTDFGGGPDRCFLNNASGGLVAGPCPSPCLADTNGDGVLTPADFTAWIAAFNAQAPQCDQNGDGACTPADFTAWIANYNAGC